MSSKIQCRLMSDSMVVHLQQIYTGFFLLHKAGIIELSQTIGKHLGKSHEKGPRLPADAHLDVIVNGALRLHYDTRDGGVIDENYLARSDYYFKRSYCEERFDHLAGQRKKIHPLGLNYLIYPDGPDHFAVSRSLRLTQRDKRLGELLRALGLTSGKGSVPTISKLWELPDAAREPKILFMVRTWDPYDTSERLANKVDEREQINAMRAECIQSLRKEFKDRFYGGFIHTQHAEKNFKSLLLPDNSLSSKSRYLGLLKAFPICVATTGLHGSIGWKLAEYVACSKAILSEKLKFQVPGNFSEGRNYLAFETADQCVEQAARLIAGRELRRELMNNNLKYYHQFLRPDALVLNSLLTALAGD